MDPNLVVGVWVAVEGQQEAFATGYLVAPGRVLTVGHVLKPGWQRIEVAEVLHPDPAARATRGARVEWPSADFAWTDDGLALDAVVLGCDTTGLAVPVAGYVNQRPDQAVDWFSNCFPHFARRGGPPTGTRLLDARGKFNPPPDGMTFTIECDEKTGSAAAWGGASGGPVFTGDLIAGVIKGWQSENGLERLVAVPAWELVAAPGFQAAVGLVREEDARAEAEWLQRDVQRVARALRSLTSRGREVVVEEFLPRVDLGDDPVGQLAAALVRWTQLIMTLASVRHELLQLPGSEADVTVLNYVEDLLMPHLFTPEDLRDFERKFTEHDAILVGGAAATSAGATARTAAHDRQPVEWKPSHDDDVTNWSGPGQHRLRAIPPGNMTPEALAFRILLDLASQIPPDLLPSTQEERQAWLRGRTAAGPGGPGVHSGVPDWSDGLAPVFRAFLRTRAAALQRTQYCLVSEKALGVRRERLVEALRILKAAVPELRFLELSRGSDLQVAEAPMIALLQLRVDERAD